MGLTMRTVTVVVPPWAAVLYDDRASEVTLPGPLQTGKTHAARLARRDALTLRLYGVRVRTEAEATAERVLPAPPTRTVTEPCPRYRPQLVTWVLTDETGPDPGLPVLCSRCGRALANVGEWCCGRFTTDADTVRADL